MRGMTMFKQRTAFALFFAVASSLADAFLPISVLGCSESCGSTVLPYPFGLTTRCGLPPFRLICRDGNTLKVRLHSVEFSVFSLSSQNIVIDPLIRSNCSTPNAYIFSSLPNYLVSPKNVIQMYNCTKHSTCTNCSVYAEVNTGYLPLSCPASFCCSLPQGNAIQNLTAGFGCNSFSSWVLEAEHSWLNVQLQLGFELLAVLPGPCSCSKNAWCKVYRSMDGHTCYCKEGFIGDGYASGVGCRKNATACNQKSFATCSRKFFLLIAGIVGGVTVAVSLIICCLIVLKRDRNSIRLATSRRSLKQIERLLSTSPMPLFSYKELEKATNGFSDSKRLGTGAFGTVYAGKFQDGRLVAVKKINNESLQGIQQVVNEVRILSAASHPNLVRLLGYCLDMEDPLLVYEYIPNGTLAEHLHGGKGEGLSWVKRIAIATETARALAYLHALDPPIYHRDVKSSNILLDLDFKSKVADFGLSRLVLSGRSSSIATTPQGTPGYLDPQYHQKYYLSDKSDVYSFGVVLVEMITGLEALDFSRGGSEINLAALALTRIASGTLDDIIDSVLFRFHEGDADKLRKMVNRLAELAFRCLSYDKDARPTMQDVLEELDSMKDHIVPPDSP